MENSFSACTWNVEGLTEVKLLQVCSYMEKNGIDVCCIQETRKSKSEYYFTEDGFYVILSGGCSSEQEFAGVGFIVSPRAAPKVSGFCQLNRRIASLKLKVLGGKVAFFCTYAPHNLKPVAERMEFYEQLSDLYSRTSVNGGKYILGDFIKLYYCSKT